MSRSVPEGARETGAGRDATSCTRAVRGQSPFVGAWGSATAVAMSCTSVPPRATFSDLHAAADGERRQAPRARAACTSAISNASRPACTSPSAGAAPRRRCAGSTSSPPVRISPCHSLEHGVGVFRLEHREDEREEPGPKAPRCTRVGADAQDAADGLGGGRDGDRRRGCMRARLRGWSAICILSSAASRPQRPPPSAPMFDSFRQSLET